MCLLTFLCTVLNYLLLYLYRQMEDNDITRGSGKGVGISINKVRGNGGGKHKTTLSHSSRFQAPRPADTQPPQYTRQIIDAYFSNAIL